MDGPNWCCTIFWVYLWNCDGLSRGFQNYFFPPNQQGRKVAEVVLTDAGLKKNTIHGWRLYNNTVGKTMVKKVASSVKIRS